MLAFGAALGSPPRRRCLCNCHALLGAKKLAILQLLWLGCYAGRLLCTAVLPAHYAGCSCCQHYLLTLRSQHGTHVCMSAAVKCAISWKVLRFVFCLTAVCLANYAWVGHVFL